MGYLGKWNLVYQHGKHLRSSYYLNCSLSPTSVSVPFIGSYKFQGTLIRRHQPHTFKSTNLGYGKTKTRLNRRPDTCFACSQLRLYSSEGDGRNASEDKHPSTIEHPSTDKGKIIKQKVAEQERFCDAHAELGELEQREWLNNEKLSIESKKKESPFLTRRERFKNEFLRRIVPWEKIVLSWDTFPYYIAKHSKSILVECAASHLKHKKLTTDYGRHLNASSGRIMLQSIPGAQLYRERIVRAVAKDLKVPLLVLDNSILASYNFTEDCSSESGSDEDAESAEEYTSESEAEDVIDDAANDEEWANNGETKSETSDDEGDARKSVEALKKLVPYDLESFEKQVSSKSEDSFESTSSNAADSSEVTNRPFRKGDPVKYVGPSLTIEADNRIVLGEIATCDGPKNVYTVIRGRTLSRGQRGEVYELGGDQVAVILDIIEEEKDREKDEKLMAMAEDAKPSIYWIPAKDIEHDNDVQAEEIYIAMEALCEVLKSVQPLIAYFPDSSLWFSKTVSKPNRKEFFQKVQEMFDQIHGPVVLICGKNKIENASKEKEKCTVILPNLRRLAKLPLHLKQFAEGITASKRSVDDDIHKLFDNAMYLPPPKDEDILGTFNKQIEEDGRFVISRSNLSELQKVLEEHDLNCLDLLLVNSDGVILTKQKAEKVVGWAKNHYLSSCIEPSIKGDRLYLPRESLEVAILRLKEQEAMSKKPSHGLKSLAKNEYESNFISAVVPPGEIGVRFDDVGALEDVKKALNELVILPMRRPELFSHGNLLRPCKGVLLFGPPGTGKTLIAKALATEAGANFMSVTGSSLTSKWFGDAEKLTKALFSFASKLAPVIIFIDEVDSLLGARGGAFEHEATRRMRNEFMSAWDGLRSKDSQLILILGATNRPFDLDDAVIRRLPRRIYVDLPDAENRLKILKVILSQENLEANFSFEQLANATEGYSGSDLKNLCIAAAYRPVQELLVEEMTGSRADGNSILRPLHLADFFQSKTKVGPSVAYDATSMNELRKWNEQYGEGGSRRKSPFGF
ncbi:unnamed protein product [Cuscuta epithymum]|uniref:AAA+ ATPase domain-containing protein n=1 Tax=Cuscuta epithymum TaxID=186058 RepID=A0AAV0C205_9ASTE|nr:unnamed protein product [Cuscuta epithymum]